MGEAGDTTARAGSALDVSRDHILGVLVLREDRRALNLRLKRLEELERILDLHLERGVD